MIRTLLKLNHASTPRRCVLAALKNATRTPVDASRSIHRMVAAAKIEVKLQAMDLPRLYGKVQFQPRLLVERLFEKDRWTVAQVRGRYDIRRPQNTLNASHYRHERLEACRTPQVERSVFTHAGTREEGDESRQYGPTVDVRL